MAQKDFYFIGVDKSDAMARDEYWQDAVEGDYDKCFDEAHRLIREDETLVNVYVAWFYEGELEDFFEKGEFPPGFANRMRVEETADWMLKEQRDAEQDKLASWHY